MSSTPHPDVPARWREEPGGTDARARTRRRRVAALLLVVGALAAVSLLALVYLRPAARVRFVPLFVTAYADPSLGAPPWRSQDRDSLLGGEFFSQTAEAPASRLDQAALVRELTALRTGPRQDAVVVYLSGFARTDAGGNVRVLPADADPEDPVTWLPLARVLELMRHAHARSRLLVLDLVPTEDPHLTLILDDVAAGIAREVEVAQDGGILVLAACAPGQRVWTSERLQQTVFGHYLDEGLRGRADGDGDGRVRVRELAGWMRSRVDRWARRARGSRQTPVLLGSGSDFTLTDLPNGQPRPPRPLADERPYPDELAKGWPKAAGVEVRENALLAAERRWRGGGDAERVPEQVKTALALTPPTPAPRPVPRSLALAGKPVARELTDELRLLAVQLAARTQGQPADKAAALRTQTAEDYLKQTKEPPVQLARAAIEAAAADPRPETLALMDVLLRKLEPEPRHVEVLMAGRLFPLGLPRATLRRSLELLRDAEQAAAEPRLQPWVSRELEQAYQTRHEALVLLESAGYASPQDADDLLTRAAARVAGVTAAADGVREALAALDRARAVLPGVLLWLRRSDRSTTGWLEVAGQTAALADLLAECRESGLGARMDEVRRQTALLGARLDDVHRPVSPEAVGRLVRSARRASAGPATWRDLDGLLAGLLPPPGARPQIHAAAADLSRRLEEDVLRLDREDVGKAVETPAVADEGGERGLQLRAREAVALLGLAGLNPVERRRFEAVLAKQPDRAALAELEGSLREGWRRLPRPDESGLWSWLADRYRYAHREYAALGREDPAAVFYHRAARDYQSWLRTPREVYATAETGEVTRLLPTAPLVTTLDVRVSVPPGSPARPRLRLFRPDEEWLGVRPDTLALPAPEQGRAFWAVPVEIRLLPEAGRGRAPQPRGILAQVRLDEGRSFHHRIEVPLSPRTPEILLSGSAAAPEPALSSIRLRPVPARQPVYLHVVNPVDRVWGKLAVRLTAGAETYTSAVFSLAARGKHLVKFPAAPAIPPPAEGLPPPAPAAGTPPVPATPPLPELKGRLRIEVVDVEKNEAVSRREVAVDIARPDEYVSVTNAAFDPTAGRNRLSVKLRLRKPMPGAAVTAALSFPAPEDGGPAVGTNTLAGKLPADLSELVLFADGVESPSGRTTFFVSVDGWARAFVFDATLTARSVVTPQQVFDPDVRPRVSGVALAGPVLKVPVEVDNAPDGSKLEVSLGRLAAGKFEAEASVTQVTPRHRRVGFLASGPQGALLFEAGVADWAVTLETMKRRGTRQLRARLLDAAGVTLAVADRTLTLDDLPAGGVKFVDLPPKAWRQAPLAVKVRADGGLVGIKAVNFFLGLPAENKVPAGLKVVPGTAANADRTLWTASLPLPPAGKGPTDVSVEVVNKVGLSSFATAQVELVENDPAKTAPGTIKGVVSQGNTPQGDLEITLYDEKFAEKAKAKTKADGSFEFKDVPPGKYRLVTARQPTGRLGVHPRPPALTFDLAPGGTVEAQIPLFLP